MIELPFEAGSFTTVYADPPWWMVGSGRAAIKRQYPLMRTSEILGMGFEVQRVTKANAHCYLWVTNSFLFEGLKVMEAWGFRYITTITWLKDRIGLGHYFRGLTEHCLFGVRGMVPYRTTEEGKRAQGRTGFCAVRGRHSEKPARMREMIETVSLGPYLELFARQGVDGWSSWGNEVPVDTGKL